MYKVFLMNSCALKEAAKSFLSGGYAFIMAIFTLFSAYLGGGTHIFYLWGEGAGDLGCIKSGHSDHLANLYSG